jgi:hypothetical protein
LADGARRVYAIGGDKPEALHIRRRSLRSLDGKRSLEGVLAVFPGEIVSDPTGAFDRARRLLAAGEEAHKLARGKLVSLHLTRSGRALHARVRKADHRADVAAILGDVFAQHLAGARFEVAILVSLKPAPKGALALRRLGAIQDDAARAAHRVSMAVAMAGAAFAVAQTGVARADTPTNRDDRRGDVLLLVPAREDFQVTPILMDGIEPQRRPPPPRRPRPQPQTEAPPPAAVAPPPAAPVCPPTLDETVRVYRVAFNDNRIFAFAQFDASDPGGEQERSGEALSFFSRQPMTALERGVSAEAPPSWMRIVSVENMRVPDPAAAGAPRYQYHFIIRAAVCAEAPPPPVPEPEPVPEPVAPPPPPEPDRAYFDLGADYVDRTEQRGGVLVAEGQFDLGGDYALNLQGAIGQIDGERAGGAQVAIQRFLEAGQDREAAIGGFVSGVSSADLNGEQFSIARAGIGAALMGERFQVVVRGGYAVIDGFDDPEGGFARVEGTWFATPDLALDLFVEEDPLTGAGAGAGLTARPFSGVFANLMIDADGAWHDDGEESFRVGLRWMLGQEDVRTVQQTRRLRGVAPILPQELERLPDDQASANQPYCGEADEGCVVT